MECKMPLIFYTTKSPIVSMPIQFSVCEVSAEFILDVAKVVASAPHPLSREDLLKSFNKSRLYLNRAISQCVQLNLINLQNGLYVSSVKHGNLLKRSSKPQLYIALRDALQNYPPFLLYVDFISKKYTSEESATMTKGIFRIESSEKTVETSFRNWGIFAKLIEVDNEKNLVIPEAEEGLSSEYVTNLLKALRANLKASIFLIETMSPAAYAYLTEKGVGIEDLSNALMNYEKDPKNSANKSTQTFEYFLFKLGEDVGANVASCHGVAQCADAIRGQNKVLKNQLQICHGIGALRNMAHHDPDNETGKEWCFTPQGAIVSTLMVPTTIRSIYLNWIENKQEF